MAEEEEDKDEPSTSRAVHDKQLSSKKKTSQVVTITTSDTTSITLTHLSYPAHTTRTGATETSTSLTTVPSSAATVLALDTEHNS